MREKRIKGSKYKIYVKLINSWHWQQLRHRKFCANPLCEICLMRGRVTPTEEVHHIKPVESGRDEGEMRRLAYDFANLQSLCKACHAEVHHPAQPTTAETISFFDKYFRKGEVF